MKWAESNDAFYKLIIENKARKFWLAHSQYKPKGFFSQDFMDLITTMLQRQPSQRLCLADIIGH